MEIAEWIVGHSGDGYDEVLVYVRPPGGSSTRRVQWTKAGGFTLLDY